MVLLGTAGAAYGVSHGDRPSDVCGEGWVCSETKREVCGVDSNGAQTTRDNKCEMHCWGEELEREGPCLKDLQDRFDACAKFKDQETACGASEGCFFTPKYREQESAYGGYSYGFVPEDIANLQDCYEVGAMNKTACNNAETEEGERQCMWDAFDGASDSITNGQCKNFDLCEDAFKKGKIGCEAAGCSYKELMAAVLACSDASSHDTQSGNFCRYLCKVGYLSSGPSPIGGKY